MAGGDCAQVHAAVLRAREAGRAALPLQRGGRVRRRLLPARLLRPPLAQCVRSFRSFAPSCSLFLLVLSSSVLVTAYSAITTVVTSVVQLYPDVHSVRVRARELIRKHMRVPARPPHPVHLSSEHHTPSRARKSCRSLFTSRVESLSVSSLNSNLSTRLLQLSALSDIERLRKLLHSFPCLHSLTSSCTLHSSGRGPL